MGTGQSKDISKARWPVFWHIRGRLWGLRVQRTNKLLLNTVVIGGLCIDRKMEQDGHLLELYNITPCYS